MARSNFGEFLTVILKGLYNPFKRFKFGGGGFWGDILEKNWSEGLIVVFDMFFSRQIYIHMPYISIYLFYAHIKWTRKNHVQNYNKAFTPNSSQKSLPKTPSEATKTLVQKKRL